MSRKHFEAVAWALLQQRPDDKYAPSRDWANGQREQWEHDVRAMADVLAGTNGRFDRGRFYRAAGYEGVQ
jgi:hypothetical protein